jgi:hypothetical protein
MPTDPRAASRAIAEEALRLNQLRPRKLTPAEIDAEKKRCTADLIYFIRTYCKIYDNITASWIAFDLWPEQVTALRAMDGHKYILEPKARQNGASWKSAARALWKMIFLPIREVLIFSQRDDEAIKLLERLRGMYERLPDWMKPGVKTDSAHELQLTNGSRVQALPATTGGRSNAATDVIIDEADFITDLALLVSNARPTIDAGDNQMIILSTINEETPNSYFQRLCKAAESGDAAWMLIFMGWQANPNRTQAWYDEQKRITLLTYGTLDPLYKHYPTNLTEALAPRELNKRFPPQWIIALAQARQKPLALPYDAPALPGLKIYKRPEPGRTYGIGYDPGGGKHDPSVSQVIDADTFEQCAVLSGLVEPTEFANQTHDLSLYYFGAQVLFELNNHGHAALAQFKERGTNLRRGIGRRGQIDREPGWLTTERSKHMLYDVGAKVMQMALAEADALNKPPEPILFDPTTIAELTSIDVSELSAPEGMHDDCAMAWVLAQMCVYRGTSGVAVARHSLWKEPQSISAPAGMSAPSIPGSGPRERPAERGFPPAFENERLVREKLRQRGL